MPFRFSTFYFKWDFKVPNIAKSRLESKLTKEKVQQTRNGIILSVEWWLKMGESNLNHTILNGTPLSQGPVLNQGCYGR